MQNFIHKLAPPLIAIAIFAIPAVGQACNQTTGDSAERSLANATTSSQGHNIGFYERVNATTFVLTYSYYEPNVAPPPNAIPGTPPGGGDGGGGNQIQCEDWGDLDTILVTAQLPGGGGWISGNWFVRVNGPTGESGGGGAPSYSSETSGLATGDDELTCSSPQGDRTDAAAAALNIMFNNNIPVGRTFTVSFAPGVYQNFLTLSGQSGGTRLVPGSTCQGS